MGHLIDKNTIIAEIKNRRDSFYSLSKSCEKSTPAKAGFYAQAQTLEGILSFLETLEIKEVDLAEEFYDFLDTLTGKDDGHLSEDELFRIAEYFFELGLKAQKGE